MLDRAQAIAEQIVGWRRHVHQHPELSFQEHETARFVAQTLREMGIAVQTGVGKTGVVGRIGSGPPVFALRADMDALPVQEATGLPFASANPGVMHACGHDVHVACLLGAARLLSETPPETGRGSAALSALRRTSRRGGIGRRQAHAPRRSDGRGGRHFWPARLV